RRRSGGRPGRAGGVSYGVWTPSGCGGRSRSSGAGVGSRVEDRGEGLDRPTYCLLPATCYLLPATCYLLPATYCLSIDVARSALALSDDGPTPYHRRPTRCDQRVPRSRP